MDQDNNINLFAFWEYDLYPYMLGGIASKMRSDGCVYVNSYQGWFRPFKLLPVEVGEELYVKIRLLGEGFRRDTNEVKEDYKKRLFEVLPDHPLVAKSGLRHPTDNRKIGGSNPPQRTNNSLDDPRTRDTNIYECTCLRDHEFIEEHSCPYKSDIHDDPITTCRCCPYCTEQCAMDI